MRSVFDHDKRSVARAVRAQRSRTLGLLERMEESAWETIVTPGWRVREAAAHLIVTDEDALTGRMLKLGLRRVPVETLERWNDEQVGRWADKPIPAILHALDVWGRRIARLASVVPAAAARRRITTPLGRVSLSWLGMMRVFDEWIHDEDIRRALGSPSDDASDVIEPVARQLFAVIPIQTLDRLPASAVGRVTLRVTDLDLPSFGLDLDRRLFGFGIDARTEIAAPAARLVMVAAGRDRWRDVEAEGVLRVSGDRQPAEVVLDALLAV
jgi:uncharacterized protein (TIGR03083 family)